MLKENPTRLRYLRQSLKFFTLIKKNLYLDRKRKSPKNDDIESCLCKPRGEDYKGQQFTNVSYNCEEGKCLNWMISTQCDDQTCYCGDLCKNRKFQRHQYACIYPYPAGGKGWGLCAGQFIKRDQFIMQYIGQIFSTKSEIGKARVKDYSKSTCTYLMKTSKGEVIDPTHKGNLARFINHSCDPNCITKKWNVLGQICIGIFAVKDIEQDEQLTFNYQFDVYSTPLTKCLCGAKKCKGYLGLKPPDISAQDWIIRLDDMICEQCGKTYEDDDVKLIICDECNKGFHVYCLDPPIQQIPQESFFCKECAQKKEEQRERAEKQRKEMLKEKKLKQIQNAKRKAVEESESEEDVLPFNEDYERMYRFLKKQEKFAAKQLIAQDDLQEEEIIKKPQTTPQKPKPNVTKQSTPSSKKKDELYELNKKAIDKFHSYLQKNQGFLQRINNFGQRKEKEVQNERKIIMLNKIQMHLILKNNFILFGKIGAQISFDINNRSTPDYFLRNTEVNILGNEEQIKMFEEIINITNQIISDLQVEMGITQAFLSIPAIYLKRLIGPGHSVMNQIQKGNQVAVYYHRRFLNEECYSLQYMCKLLIKGGKQNIIKAYEDIKRRISILQVERIYLNPYEIKTIVTHMTSLKKKSGMAEFRINRETPFKQVNHPFFYIQQKNKEIAIIGTRVEIQKTRRQILSFFEEPNRKEQYNYNISLFLAQPSHKSSLLSVKNSLEREISTIKMMIFDPTPPRKNMTLSFLGTRDNRQKARQYLFRRLEQLGRQGKTSINLEHFQDQMNYQMTKYYFKYMQNTLLTKDTAFMKSWDILNNYYSEEEPNYMWKSVRKQLLSDYETLLYACFVLKQKLIKKIQSESDSSKSTMEEVFEIVRQNMSRILNIYNVNSTSGLKNYTSVMDTEISKKYFRETYPHIHFNKSQEISKNQVKEQFQQQKQSKEKELSFFERKVFKKYKHFYNMIEEERDREKGRDREEDRKKSRERQKWR